MSTAAQPDDPYAAMLRGALLPTVVLGAACVALAAASEQGPGIVGALLAVVIVVVSFSSSLLVMRWAARTNPANVMAAALATYVGKVGLLGLFLILFGRAEWMSGTAFGLTAIASAAVWLLFEARAYYRMRTLVFGVPEQETGPS